VGAIARRRQGLTQIGVALGAIQLYEALRRLLHPDWSAAVANARRIEALERAGHLAWEQSLQAAFLGRPLLVQATNLFYFAGHFLATALFFLWLYRRSPAGFRRWRDAFLLATAIALAVHWAFPTAPPRLAGVGVLDTLHRFSGIDIGSTSAASFYDPVAAVPSLHAAYAVGVGAGLVCFGRSRVARAAGVAYPLAVLWTILVTGNHFVLDAVAGAAVLGLGFVLTGASRAILRAATRGGAVR
jgi:PAP2 superfamily